MDAERGAGSNHRPQQTPAIESREQSMDEEHRSLSEENPE